MAKAMTRKQIESDPRIEEVWTEQDGWNENGRPAYWATLRTGFQWDGCHTLHEGNLRDLTEALAGVTSCECDGCVEAALVPAA